jgi:hypothetical protein
MIRLERLYHAVNATSPAQFPIDMEHWNTCLAGFAVKIDALAAMGLALNFIPSAGPKDLTECFPVFECDGEIFYEFDALACFFGLSKADTFYVFAAAEYRVDYHHEGGWCSFDMQGELLRDEILTRLAYALNKKGVTV